MKMAKESGVYSEEKIKEGKEVLYDLISVKPRTFGEFRNPHYRGSPFFHSHFLGVCLKRLKEEGRIAEREIGRGWSDREFYAVEGLAGKLKVKARHLGEDLYDSFVSLWRKKWVEQSTVEFSASYPPGHFSAYLAYCTMERDRTEEGRKSGWEAVSEEGPSFNRVKGKKSTVSGDVTLELGVLNARGCGRWYDEVSLSATFRRASKEEMRVPPSAHGKYGRKIIGGISEIGFRSQVTELYADRVLVAAGREDGSVDAEKAEAIIGELESLVPDKHSVVTEPMLREFYCQRARTPKDLERHEELVAYLRRRTAEKAGRLCREIPMQCA
jgi:hypothetical protein